MGVWAGRVGSEWERGCSLTLLPIHEAVVLQCPTLLRCTDTPPGWPAGRPCLQAAGWALRWCWRAAPMPPCRHTTAASCVAPPPSSPWVRAQICFCLVRILRWVERGRHCSAGRAGDLALCLLCLPAPLSLHPPPPPPPCTCCRRSCEQPAVVGDVAALRSHRQGHAIWRRGSPEVGGPLVLPPPPPPPGGGGGGYCARRRCCQAHFNANAEEAVPVAVHA